VSSNPGKEHARTRFESDWFDGLHKAKFNDA